MITSRLILDDVLAQGEEGVPGAGCRPAYPQVIEELIPAACYVTEQYANNSVETNHGRLKARLRPCAEA
jgi:transposase, IS6 family